MLFVVAGTLPDDAAAVVAVDNGASVADALDAEVASNTIDGAWPAGAKGFGAGIVDVEIVTAVVDVAAAGVWSWCLIMLDDDDDIDAVGDYAAAADVVDAVVADDAVVVPVVVVLVEVDAAVHVLVLVLVPVMGADSFKKYKFKLNFEKL